MPSELGQLTPDGVRFERELPAPPDEIWQALTDPARLPAWLSEVDGDLVLGGAVTVRMSQPVRVVVKRCKQPKLLSVSWAFPDEPVTELSVMVNEDSVITLTQSGLAEKAASRYRTAWHVHLDLLVEHLAGRPGFDFMPRYTEVKALYAAG